MEHEAPQAGLDEAKVNDVKALLDCGVPLDRLCAVQPHGLSEVEVQHIAEEWIKLKSSEHHRNYLPVAHALLQRCRSALQDKGFCETLLESLDSEAPAELLDPLFYTLMHDPVVLSSGIVLDRETALDERGLRFRQCPCTREQLKADVYPLIHLREKLVDFVQGRLSSIFELVHVSLDAAEPSAAEFMLVQRAIEIGRKLLKGIGRNTFLGETQKLARLRLQVLRMKLRVCNQELLLQQILETYHDLCEAARSQGPPETAGTVLAEAMAELMKPAQQCLAEGGEEGPVEAQQWLQGAAQLAVDLVKPGGRPNAAPPVSLSSSGLLEFLMLLLRVAQAPMAKNKRCISEGQALASVCLVLQRAGSKEDLEQFMISQGLQPSQLAELSNESDLKVEVARMSDRNSQDRWEPLGGPLRPLAPVLSIAVSCKWRDQGWGNKKGNIRVVLLRSREDGEPEEVASESIFGVFGADLGDEHRQLYWDQERGLVDAQTTLGTSVAVVNLFRPGDQLKFEYHVGGGGGHELHIREFVVRVQVEQEGSKEEGSPRVQLEGPPDWLAPLVRWRGASSEDSIQFSVWDNPMMTIRFALENGVLVKHTLIHNDVVEMSSVSRLSYLHTTSSLQDGSGWETEMPRDAVPGLRALAERAGVPWEEVQGLQLFSDDDDDPDIGIGGLFGSEDDVSSDGDN